MRNRAAMRGLRIRTRVDGLNEKRIVRPGDQVGRYGRLLDLWLLLVFGELVPGVDLLHSIQVHVDVAQLRIQFILVLRRIGHLVELLLSLLYTLHQIHQRVHLTIHVRALIALELTDCLLRFQNIRFQHSDSIQHQVQRLMHLLIAERLVKSGLHLLHFLDGD